MNKAQNEYLEDLFSPYSGELRSFTKETFALYADRYNEIDPTPDLEFYDIYRTDSFGKYLDVEDLYEQEATNSLLFIMRGEGDENVKEYVKGSHLITENAKYEIRKRSQGKFDE